jgi:hypothetical protein
MDILENCALEALKAAIPFHEAEQLAASCAREAVQQLDSYNQKYRADNIWYEDGKLVPVVPMEKDDIETAVGRLSRCYLLLWHRRGLIGS